MAPFPVLGFSTFWSSRQDKRKRGLEKKGNLKSIKGEGYYHPLRHQLWAPSSMELPPHTHTLFYPLNKTFCACLNVSQVFSLQHTGVWRAWGADGTQEPDPDLFSIWYHLWFQLDRVSWRTTGFGDKNAIGLDSWMGFAGHHKGSGFRLNEMRRYCAVKADEQQCLK